MNGASFFQPGPRLEAAKGQHIPGGCDDCGAHQVLNEHSPGVYLLEIRHDSTCPTYRHILAQRARGQQ